MKEGQEKIYYIIVDSYVVVKSSLYFELLCKKGIEVLLFFDCIDEWMMSYLIEFDGKVFQFVVKVDELLDKLVDEVDEFIKEVEKVLELFVEWVKNLFGDWVKEVCLIYCLIDILVIVIIDVDEMSIQMVKLFVVVGQVVLEVKYIFELNLVYQLVKCVVDIQDDVQFGEWVELLLDQVLLVECGMLEDLNQFICCMNQLLVF